MLQVATARMWRKCTIRYMCQVVCDKTESFLDEDKHISE